MYLPKKIGKNRYFWNLKGYISALKSLNKNSPGTFVEHYVHYKYAKFQLDPSSLKIKVSPRRRSGHFIKEKLFELQYLEN